MNKDILLDFQTFFVACDHVLAWGMGYTPNDTERTAKGDWLQHGSSSIPFKHQQLILVAAGMAVYGQKVLDDDFLLPGIARWWGISLTPDEWRIPPDEWCERMGLTRPIETPTAELYGEDIAACQDAYVAWIQTFWNNTRHRALVERLAAALLSRQTWAGADIAAFLDESAQALGPGALEAPV